MIRNYIDQLLSNYASKIDTYNRLEISKSALYHNAKFYEEATNQPIIPVLKANAYGHGLEQVARALSGGNFPFLAVDSYFEALRVRQYSNIPILIMGPIKPSNFAKLKVKNIAYVVQDRQTIKVLAELGKPANIHLEINTGMNRQGIAPADIDEYISLIQKFSKLNLEGVMTHLAEADSQDDRYLDQPIKIFDDTIDKIIASGLTPKWFHAGQSAGSLRVKSNYTNISRIGIGLYGINPFSENHQLYKKCQKLRPAMCFISAISHINELKASDKISYNYTFTAAKDMRVGVLPLGYYEGLNRALSNSGVVKIGNHYQPIVGQICMNHTMVDLGDTNAQVGDEAVIYSNNPTDENSINNIAAEHKLLHYELLTRLSPTVRRSLAG